MSGCAHGVRNWMRSEQHYLPADRLTIGRSDQKQSRQAGLIQRPKPLTELSWRQISLSTMMSPRKIIQQHEAVEVVILGDCHASLLAPVDESPQILVDARPLGRQVMQ